MTLRPTNTARILLPSMMIVPLFCFALAGGRSPSGTGVVSEIAAMHIARASHTSTLLPNGKVLIAGGFAGSGGAAGALLAARAFAAGHRLHDFGGWGADAVRLPAQPGSICGGGREPSVCSDWVGAGASRAAAAGDSVLSDAADDLVRA